MTGPIAWPDLAIGAVLVLAVFLGFRRGFIREVAGLVALAALIVLPHYYNGAADATIDRYAKLGPIGSHLVGMLLTGIFAYVVIIVVAGILNRIAKFPIIGTGNAVAGAVVGLVKAVVFIWLVLYVALFFPLDAKTRTSLRESKIVPYFVTMDGIVDGFVESAVPDLARPYVDPYFDRHHL